MVSINTQQRFMAENRLGCGTVAGVRVLTFLIYTKEDDLGQVHRLPERVDIGRRALDHLHDLFVGRFDDQVLVHSLRARARVTLA
jgi:hypothetical protein